MFSKKHKYIRISLIYLISNALVFFIALLYKRLFITSPELFECTFYNYVGFYCFGCGGSRALLALLDFKTLKAFLLYPPLVITALLALFVDIIGIIALLLKTPEVLKKIKAKYFLIIPISIIAFFFLRNILLLLGFDLTAFADKL